MSDPYLINADPSIERQGNGRRSNDAQREYLARLVSQMPEAVVCFDRDWRITFANDEAFRVSRIKPEHLNNRSHWELFPEMVGTQLERTYRAVMQSGVPAHLEYFCKPYDVWLDTHVFPMDEGIAVYFRDITDRKGAELLRDAASNQLLQVLQATSDAVASVDRAGNFTFLNRRARELLAVKGDLIGKNIWDEFPAGLKQGSYLYHYNRAMYEGLPGDFEDYYPEPLNMWLSIQVRPYSDGVVIFFRDITASRQAYSDLQFQQELLTTIQQTARVATWDVDLATGKVTYGPGSYPVFGHPFSETPQLDSFRKVILPEYVPIVDDLIKRTIETGETILIDCPLRAADGTIVWIESRGHAVKIDGVPARLRGLSIDITDRKHNEEALSTSEARYRILADLNPQAIWMGSPIDGRITYANQIMLDSVGFTDQSLDCDTWLQAFHPGDRQRVHETWHNCVDTGADFDIEARMIRAYDGRSRWWWLRAQPVRDESGNILHWLGVCIDIDDRKTFAETLQLRQEETERQRSELESIYKSAPIGFALFDPVELRYLRVNDRQVETIGLPREQILGRKIIDLIPLPGLEVLLRRAAAGETIRNQLLEGELPGRPGEYRYFNVNYAPVRNVDGTVEAVAAVVQEITHQKRAEAALIQSEKLAAVGRLASSISHEINNPLEAITNLIYLIATADTLPSDIADYVATAQSELSRVCQIATQTLRFHRQAVSATDVTPAELVNAVLNLYHGRLANSRITVETIYKTSSTIHCFENDIRQVLNNLIANAIDAMRQGGGRLIASAHDATDHPTGRKGVRITIADTGHGMSPAVRERIFEPFYTTKDLNGTGLGLWISSGIVNRHQGRLTLRTTEHPTHHGTIFSLFLPYTETPEE